MKIEKNLWTLFALLALGSFLLLLLLLSSKYKEIKTAYYLEHTYYSEVLLNTTNTVLLQYESMLSLLGNQLVHKNRYKDTRESHAILKETLKLNDSLLSFALLSPEGDYLALSGNLSLSSMPNLLKDPRTKEGFMQSLKSKKMVLGRTYKLEALNTWVIPLRKAIRDDDGKVIAVMTSGIKIHTTHGFLEDLELADRKTVAIVKDIDSKNKSFRQYYSDFTEKTSSKVYTTLLSKKIYEQVEHSLMAFYGLDLNAMRHRKDTHAIELIDPLGRKIVAGIGYSQRYKLWVLVEGESEVFENSFRRTFVVYLASYLLSMMIIYFLFRYIAQGELSKREDLLFQASHDTLTGLANRQYMYEHIQSWQADINSPYYVLYIDLDNFKNINDNHGHHVGDAILQEVSTRLRTYFSHGEMLVRQGGDEFIVLSFQDNIHRDMASFTAFISVISESYYYTGLEFRVGASIGVAQFPKDSQKLEHLLSLADIAMYEAKKSKNKCVVFTKEMHASQEKKVIIEQKLRGALERNEIYMNYQPQISHDGSFCGVEALVRWENIHLGFVSPDEFIHVAEDSGIMNELGRFIIERSLEEFAEIQSVCEITFNLSINLSVKQLVDEDFLTHLLQSVKTHQCDISRITLEITESLFIEDMEYVLPILKDIRARGFGLSLDDFGTGFSSLSMLRQLPISELKVDKSFVDDILDDEQDRVLTQSIIDVGKNLKMTTVAEGVETKEQVDLLKSMNCAVYQGYYYSKPLSAEKLIAYINEQTKS